MPLDLFDPSHFGFPEGSLIYSCEPPVRKAIIEARIRLRGAQVFSLFWQRVLTADERNRLGGNMEGCFAADNFAPNHLMRLRDWPGEHAIVEIAYRANFLTPTDYEWLLECLGVNSGSESNGQSLTEQDVPEWSRGTGRLEFRGDLCRQLNVMRATQIVPILDEFQLHGWPDSIDSPVNTDIDRQRIHDAVSNLNRSLAHVRFRVQGDSICWEC